MKTSIRTFNKYKKPNFFIEIELLTKRRKRDSPIGIPSEEPPEV